MKPIMYHSPGIYRSYTGLLTIVGLLLLITMMGLVSYFYTNLLLLQAGILLIIFAMGLDLALVQSRILKKKLYLAHHGITMFWASVGFFYAETLVGLKAGVFVYMLLGATFRRLLKIAKDIRPQSKHLHTAIYRSMVFFDFCDPLVILLLWDWLMTLSPYHRAFYLVLASVRLVINGRAYPQIMEAVTKGWSRMKSAA